MRIDVYLVESGLATSRTEAKRCIEEGRVRLNGTIVTKPSYDISDGFEDLSVLPPEVSFVGRGGIKLEGAIKAFGIEVKNKLCLDVGASSGGFTDCLLQRGATHVIAVDSGRGQLVSSLREDKRVTSIEGFNARYMTPADLQYSPQLAVMDVSFISATYIIPSVSSCLQKGGDFILLIKPQFEVGRSGIGKGGIVKSEKARQGAVEKVVSFAGGFGLELVKIIESPIRGGDGNVEYLAHFIRA